MNENFLLISDLDKINFYSEKCKFLDCSNKLGYEIFNDLVESEEVRKLQNVELTKFVGNKLEKYERIFINIEAKVNGSNRSEFKAIDFVFWLRIKYLFTGEIIIYGFLSANQILMLSPKNVVIHAPGNLYFQIGSKPKLEGNSVSIKLVKEELFNLYTPFIKKFIDKDELRHFKANWWAVKTMWDVHNVSKRKKLNVDYPEFVKNQLDNLNNYLFCEYHNTINDYSITDITNQIRTDFKNSENVINNKKDAAKSRIKKIKQERISKIEGIRAEISEYLFLVSLCDEKIENYNQEKIDLLTYSTTNETYDFDLKIKEQQDEKLEYEQEITQLRNKLIELEQKEIKPSKSNENELTEFSWENYDLEVLYNYRNNENSSSNNKFLIIDDMANSGWLALYKKIFPEKEFLALEAFDWNKSSIEELKVVIKKKVFEERPSAIILDIRLLPDDNMKLTHEALSGFKVLDYIKENFAYIPVLMTSASNKIWSFKESINGGAIGYWVKEGIDNLFTKEETISNYLALKENISLFGEDLVNKNIILQNFKRNLLDVENSFWWENMQWSNQYFANKPWSSNNCKAALFTRKNNKTSSLTKNQVSKKIDEIIDTLEDAIKHQLTFNSKNISEIFRYFYIQRIADIIETIHPVIKINSNTYTVAEVLTCRGDYKAGLLYEYRNKVIHNNIFELDKSKKTKTGNFIKKVHDFDAFFDYSLGYLSEKELMIDNKFIKIQENIASVYKKEQDKVKAAVIDTKVSKPITVLEKLEKKKIDVTAHAKQSNVVENINDLKDNTKKDVIDIVSSKEKDESLVNVNESETAETKEANDNSDKIEDITKQEINFFSRFKALLKKWFNF